MNHFWCSVFKLLFKPTCWLFLLHGLKCEPGFFKSPLHKFLSCAYLLHFRSCFMAVFKAIFNCQSAETVCFHFQSVCYTLQYSKAVFPNFCDMVIPKSKCSWYGDPSRIKCFETFGPFSQPVSHTSFPSPLAFSTSSSAATPLLPLLTAKWQILPPPPHRDLLLNREEGGKWDWKKLTRRMRRKTLKQRMRSGICENWNTIHIQRPHNPCFSPGSQVGKHCCKVKGPSAYTC